MYIFLFTLNSILSIMLNIRMKYICLGKLALLYYEDHFCYVSTTLNVVVSDLHEICKQVQMPAMLDLLLLFKLL